MKLLRKRVCFMWLILFLTALVCPLALQAQGTEKEHVIDLMPEFFRFWKAAGAVSVPQRVALFNATLVKDHPELFGPNVMFRGTPNGPERRRMLDQKIRTFVADIGPQVPTMRLLAGRIEREESDYSATFRKTFPAFQPKVPFYVTISLGDFAGGERDIEGRPALVFGVDSIAKVEGAAANLSVLFDHELLHIYRAQFVPAPPGDENSPLWKLLWEEGLATYVSFRMNPTVKIDDVFFEKNLFEKCEPRESLLAQLFLQRFSSNDDAGQMEFFAITGHPPGFPPTAGYYLGFRVAEELGRVRSLEELARLPLTEVQSEASAILVKISQEPKQ